MTKNLKEICDNATTLSWIFVERNGKTDLYGTISKKYLCQELEKFFIFKGIEKYQVDIAAAATDNWDPYAQAILSVCWIEGNELYSFLNYNLGIHMRGDIE